MLKRGLFSDVDIYSLRIVVVFEPPDGRFAERRERSVQFVGEVGDLVGLAVEPEYPLAAVAVFATGDDTVYGLVDGGKIEQNLQRKIRSAFVICRLLYEHAPTRKRSTVFRAGSMPPWEGIAGRACDAWIFCEAILSMANVVND